MCIRDRLVYQRAAVFADAGRNRYPFGRKEEAGRFILCVSAVSYTHLDVYKRQVFHFDLYSHREALESY